MSDKKQISLLIIIGNVIGIICLIYLGTMYLTHNHAFVNIKTMFPIEMWDFAGMMLCIELLPLTVANILAYLNLEIKKKAIKFAFFIPGFLCLLMVISYILESI